MSADKESKAAKPAKAPKAAKPAKKGQDVKASKDAAEPKAARPSRPTGPVRLQAYYRDTVVKDLSKQFGYKTVMQVPRIEKIVLNMGVGEAVADKKIMENAVADMAKIGGQKPIVTKARTSIANFKIRTGYPVGCKLTLRGARMYEFLDRLVNIAMPRIRDFRGVSGKSFDGRGNYAMGLKEHIVFPEINYDEVDDIRGMDIIVCTTAATNEEAKALLAECGFPFRN